MGAATMISADDALSSNLLGMRTAVRRAAHGTPLA
jgi:hypothetical protein